MSQKYAGTGVYVYLAREGEQTWKELYQLTNVRPVAANFSTVGVRIVPLSAV